MGFPLVAAGQLLLSNAGECGISRFGCALARVSDHWPHNKGGLSLAVTISDVARLARVSTATVSRVLNGTTHVDSGTAQQVNAAVKTLGYRPNRAARSLRTQRSTVLGLIISDIRNPLFTDMVRAIEDMAHANDFSLVLSNSADCPNRERRYLELAVAENLSGVMLAPGLSDVAAIRRVVCNGIPVVTVNGHLDTDLIDQVVIDNMRAVESAVTHLVEQGRTRIGCISGQADAYISRQRLAGFRSGLRQAGLECHPDWVQHGDFHTESGTKAMARLLDSTDVDAVIVFNNMMTLGAWMEIKRRGVLIPDQLAIVGFDNAPWADALTPTLTTVRQPIYDLGSTTVRLLLDRIVGYTGVAREVVLPATLEVRQSSMICR